jgi:sialate O-acetylesterase
MKKSAIAIAFAVAAMAVRAALTPASLFTDHCVLQRGRNVPVWGMSAPGAMVSVSFAGQVKKTNAGADGRWRIDLGSLEASCEPRNMRIVAEGEKREEVLLKDVLVGVVWLCGGQSNMTFQMWPSPRIGQHAGRELNGYYDLMLTSEPLVRGVCMPIRWGDKEKECGSLKWFAFTPDNYADGKDFSAAAWHFAVRLGQALKIPVGVIEAGWGGSCIETWIPPEGYRASKNFKELATRKIMTVPTPEMIAKERQTGKKPSLHQQPRACWNGMIYPLAPYGIEGAIWYQGCTNRGKWKEYYEMLTALRTGWSKRFEVGDMPFFLCQITPYDYGFKNEQADPGNIEIREEMERFGLSNGDRVGCAVLSDIGELDCIHPGDKRTVGTRLAALALNRIYGMKNLKCDAPVFEKALLSTDSKRVTLSFRHVEGWCMKGAYAPRFELAGTNGVYMAVKSIIDAKKPTVDLVVPDGMKPVKVAYMRRSCVHGFLKNESGLPLGPFRGAVATGR